MNYLAHLSLLQAYPERMPGGLLADYLRGRLPEAPIDPWMLGALHHRMVDSFTDQHAQVLAAKQYFSPLRRRFAGIILDIVFDHFLAKNFENYYAQALNVFIAKSYKILASGESRYPAPMRRVVRRMQQMDLLGSYYYLENLEMVFQGLASRFSRPVPLIGSTEEIMQHYDKLENHFQLFYPDLMRVSDQWLASR
ncbi:MAG: DUF479 domain-containing protein [Gammaproteobacteria bacterium]|nr:DUF479 domain-containing protein [Gammaproteobacteria bacterium]